MRYPHRPIDSHKLAIKLYVTDESALKANEFVPLFHSWIQQHKLPDHLMIDVADYQHVPDGPGTLLISSEANLAMDRMDGRLGLLYVRKLPFAGANSLTQRLRALFRIELEAALRLEEEPALGGRIRFSTGEISFRIQDRLLGPNTAETFAAVKGDLESLVTETYGSAPLSLEFKPSADRLFEVRIQAPRSPAIADLLQRPGLVSVR